MDLGWSALTDVAGGAEELIMLIFGESASRTKATDKGDDDRECKNGAGQTHGMLTPWCAIVNNCRISRNDSLPERNSPKNRALQTKQLPTRWDAELEVTGADAEITEPFGTAVPADGKLFAKDTEESAKNATASEKETVVSAKFAGIPMDDIKQVIISRPSGSLSTEDCNKDGNVRLFSPTDPEWLKLAGNALHDQGFDTYTYGNLTVPSLGDDTNAIAKKNPCISRLEEIEQDKTKTSEAFFVDISSRSSETQASAAETASQDRLSFIHHLRLSNVSEALNLPIDTLTRSSRNMVKVVDATGDDDLCKNLTLVRLDPQADI